MVTSIVTWISAASIVLIAIVLVGVLIIRHDFQDITRRCDEARRKFESTELKNIKEILHIQLQMLENYYRSVLRQANLSFIFALIFASLGILMFFSTIVFMMFGGSGNITTAGISVISGTIVQVISGINFILYGRASNQLHTFHKSLESMQNFVLANSICQGLEEPTKALTCSQLVLIIASASNGAYQEETIGEGVRRKAMASVEVLKSYASNGAQSE
jgi:hypothetical protein